MVLLRPLSTDPKLVTDLARAMEAAHDMDCFERKCECVGTPEHNVRAERGRALVEAKKAK